MYNKLTNSQKEDKILKLTRLLNEIEFDSNPDRDRHAHPDSKLEIAKWRKFCALPKQDQLKLLEEWKVYYENVKQSPVYDLFQEQRKAMDFTKVNNEPIEEQAKLKQERWQRIRELGQQARLMRENGDLNTVTKPSSIDPWEFNQGWVKAYKDCEQAIKDLKAEVSMGDPEDVKGVWDGNA